MLVGNALVSIANARRAEADLAGSRMHYAEALRIFQMLGYESGIALVTSNLTETHLCAGDGETALRHVKEALS